MIERKAILGLLLAGGLSTRMGGGDKPLRTIGGRTILDHVLDRLSPQVGRIVINANGDPARFASWGHPVVLDTIEGFAGPLAGILAGMERQPPLPPSPMCCRLRPTRPSSRLISPNDWPPAFRAAPPSQSQAPVAGRIPRLRSGPSRFMPICDGHWSKTSFARSIASRAGIRPSASTGRSSPTTRSSMPIGQRIWRRRSVFWRLARVDRGRIPNQPVAARSSVLRGFAPQDSRLRSSGFEASLFGMRIVGTCRTRTRLALEAPARFDVGSGSTLVARCERCACASRASNHASAWRSKARNHAALAPSW
jgi:MobA-like NTP transferase domain